MLNANYELIVDFEDEDGDIRQVVCSFLGLPDEGDIESTIGRRAGECLKLATWSLAKIAYDEDGEKWLDFDFDPNRATTGRWIDGFIEYC